MTYRLPRLLALFLTATFVGLLSSTLTRQAHATATPPCDGQIGQFCFATDPIERRFELTTPPPPAPPVPSYIPCSDTEVEWSGADIRALMSTHGDPLCRDGDRWFIEVLANDCDPIGMVPGEGTVEIELSGQTFTLGSLTPIPGVNRGRFETATCLTFDLDNLDGIRYVAPSGASVHNATIRIACCGCDSPDLHECSCPEECDPIVDFCTVNFPNLEECETNSWGLAYDVTTCSSGGSPPIAVTTVGGQQLWTVLIPVPGFSNRWTGLSPCFSPEDLNGGNITCPVHTQILAGAGDGIAYACITTVCCE